MAKFKDVLGTISPAYGILTGHGAIGQIAEQGGLGVAPALLAKERSKKRGAPMKRGGEVNKYAKGGNIDGCATKGRTKGSKR